MPAACSRALLASELETAPRAPRPGCRARASMNRLTVEPVPTPMVAPSSTSASAACARVSLLGVDVARHGG